VSAPLLREKNEVRAEGLNPILSSPCAVIPFLR
jgi:hypothetical protein